jgi:hypothetical protein
VTGVQTCALPIFASDMKVQIYVTIEQKEYIVAGNLSTSVGLDNVTK